MKTEAIAVAEAFIGAINRHSVPDLSALMPVNHTFVDSQGRSVAGRDAMVAGWTAYFTLFPDYHVTAERFLADGDTVAIFGHASGTFHGPRGGSPENRIAMPSAWKAVIAGSTVQLWQVYADWTEGMKIVERESGKS